jgi:hypothetical protein
MFHHMFFFGSFLRSFARLSRREVLDTRRIEEGSA